MMLEPHEFLILRTFTEKIFQKPNNPKKIISPIVKNMGANRVELHYGSCYGVFNSEEIRAILRSNKVQQSSTPMSDKDLLCPATTMKVKNL